MTHFRVFWKTLLIVTIISVGSLLPASQFPEIVPKFWDKGMHFFAYALLTFIALLDTRIFFLRSSTKNHRWFIYTAILCLVWGGIMEICQGYLVPYRSMDRLDMLANSVGVGLGSFLFWLFIALLNPKNSG